jgi:transposase
MTPEFFAGLDAHVAYVQVAVVDKSGRLQVEQRVRTQEPAALLAALAPYAPLEAVVETSPFWAWVYDLLTPAGIAVRVAHARDLRAIATSHRKTDEGDARLLARMLAAGLIPGIYPKAPRQRELLTLLRHRRLLVQERTALANRIHAQLHQQRLSLPRARLLRRGTRAWLRTTAWPRLTREQRRLVGGHLVLIRLLRRMVRALDRHIAAAAADSAAARVLQTIPGIGPYGGLLLGTELTPITRFASPRHLVGYAGLAPSTRSSAGRTKHGRIPRAANHAVRGVLVSAIPTHVRCAPESSLSRYYAQQKARLGWPVARVAAARRLGTIVYHMLATGEAWRG